MTRVRFTFDMSSLNVPQILTYCSILFAKQLLQEVISVNLIFYIKVVLIVIALKRSCIVEVKLICYFS